MIKTKRNKFSERRVAGTPPKKTPLCPLLAPVPGSRGERGMVAVWTKREGTDAPFYANVLESPHVTAQNPKRH